MKVLILTHTIMERKNTYKENLKQRNGAIWLTLMVETRPNLQQESCRVSDFLFIAK